MVETTSHQCQHAIFPLVLVPRSSYLINGIILYIASWRNVNQADCFIRKVLPSCPVSQDERIPLQGMVNFARRVRTQAQ